MKQMKTYGTRVGVIVSVVRESEVKPGSVGVGNDRVNVGVGVVIVGVATGPGPPLGTLVVSMDMVWARA